MNNTGIVNISDENVEELLNEVASLSGYEFKDYARASLKRRISRFLVKDRLTNFAELLYRVKSDLNYQQHLVEQLTVNITEMFRDPSAFKMIRNTVLPLLATNPFIRIWHAGCSTGEEVYSMAIMLDELNILHKSLLYATDLNSAVIENVKRGLFPISQMKQYSENYISAGGKKDFSEYYTAKYDWAKFNERLKKRLVLATHNLVSDKSFNQFNLILCRNVLIYFNKELQNKTLSLFNESLDKPGFLVLGSKENIKLSPLAKNFQQIDSKEKIWRKMS